MRAQGVTVVHRLGRATLAVALALALAVALALTLVPARASAATTAPTTAGPRTTTAADPRTHTTTAAAPRADAGDRPLLVVGFAGVSWDDVTPARMPRLAALAATGGTADLVVRTVHDATCPVDGWLTLGAGARATGPDTSCTPVPGPARRTVDKPGPPTAITRPGTVTTLVAPRWSDYARATRESLSGARLGTLAATQPGACTLGPGAGLALADPTGTYTGWRGAPLPAALAGAAATCRTVVVDAGTLPPRADTAMARALDARIGQALDAAPGADVVALSLADVVGPSRLRPLVVHAPGYDGRVLSSPSTRQAGLVLLTDVAPTLARLRGTPAPAAWTGDAVTAGSNATAARRLDAARDTDLLAARARSLAAPFFVGWTVLLLVTLAALGVAWRAGWRRGRVALAVAATAFAAVPAASFLARLVPWWRQSLPELACAVTTAGIALALTALAWAGPWRRHPLGPFAALAALTALVLAGDAATGSHLTISSLLGEHPTVGGRFYGLGNVASGLLAASTLVLMTGLLEAGYERRHTRLAAALTLLLGLGVAALVVAPGLGADFGGFAALLPAVLYLGLRGLGLRLDAGRLAVLAILTLGLLAAACLLDWLRPAEQRTHLGRFADSVLRGAGDDVVARKLVQNWSILTSSGWTLAIPVVLLLLTFAVWRPGRVPGRPFTRLFGAVPLLRLGLLAVAMMLWTAFLLNDSGATVPVPVGFLVVPGVVSVAALAARSRRASAAPATPAQRPSAAPAAGAATP